MAKRDEEPLNWSIVLVIIMGSFTAILVSSSVNVALPTLMALFNINAGQAQWILTAYMLTMGVVMPLSGYLGDRFGYKRIYFLSLALFTGGSLLGGMAWNLPTLIVCRVIQAVGGGLMQPLGMAIVYREYPRNKIGVVMGVYGIAAMAAPAIGPTLGGYLVEFFSWHWLFFINVPIGLLSLFFTQRVLNETPRITNHRLDLIGMLTISGGLFCLLFVLANGNRYGWGAPVIVGLGFLSVLLLSIMVITELNHPEPIVDLRLLKDGIYTISLVVGSILAIGMFGGMFLIPIYLQNILGESAFNAGIIMFPAALASGALMPISGKIFDRWGAKWAGVPGLALVAFGTYVMSKFTVQTPFILITSWMIVRGIGMGLSMIPINTAGMTNIPVAKLGRATSLANVSRQVAASLGVAVFTTILQHQQVIHYANTAQNVNAEAMNHLYSALGTLPGTAIASLVAQKINLMAYMQSINDCFLIASLVCLLGMVMTFFINEKKVPAAISEPLKLEVELQSAVD
ncbi:MAG: DHA2 family efflux MFS transporter permease subunit [Methylocystaceae bacterium]